MILRLLALAVLISGAASADSLPPQTIKPPGTSAPAAQAVQGVSGGVAVPISGSVTVSSASVTQGTSPWVVSGTVTASGPLTDTQLRAATVPVSGTVTATGPLTDTQLRATAVPVSGTVTANISGSISNTAFAQTTTAVSSASSPGSCVSVTANTTVLAANAGRHAAYILPKSSNTDNVHIKLGATATTAAPPLSPGQPFNLDPAGSIYTGQIDAIAASGTQSVCVIEW